MRKHIGKREREARNRRKWRSKTVYSVQDITGVVTLKLGRKKFSESHCGLGSTVAILKKKFRGCVVDTERQPKSCAGEQP